MGGSCCKRKQKPDSLPLPTHTHTNASSYGTFLTTTTSGAFETTIFPWQSRKFGKKPALTTTHDTVADLPGVDRPQTPSEQRLILEGLLNNAILGELSEDLHEKLRRSMKTFEVPPLMAIYEAGSEATAFFVVTSGLLEALVKGERIRDYQPGTSFGATALLYDQLRKKTVHSLTNATLWRVERKVFKHVLAEHNASLHLENLAFLRSIKMLDKLTDEQVEALAEQLSTLAYSCGSTIVTEGEPGSVLYIIKQGSVSCSWKGQILRYLHHGDYFGEQALLYDPPRTATVTAATDTKVLTISRDSLNRALGDTLTQVTYKNCIRIAFGKHPQLSLLLPAQQEVLMDNIDVITVNQDSKVEVWLAVLLQGSLRLADDSVIEQLEVLESSAVALSECRLAVLRKEAVERELGGSLEKVAEDNEAELFLRNVPLCRGFSAHKLRSLWSALHLQRYETGATVLREGEEGSTAFLVKSGAVQVVKQGEVLRVIERYGLFGERALMEKSVRTATVIATQPTECFVLQREDFERALDSGALQYLASRMQLQNDKVTLASLEVVSYLGNGCYGNVFLVLHRQSESLYALKTVSRKVVRIHDLSGNLLQERELLLQLEHPFIMKLVKTFKDSSRLYFLMEFVPGEGLFELLNRVKTLSSPQCRFYIACLLLALEHLQERDIAYRDLKPENVIVDEQGYPKLIDFGLAKRVSGRTYSIVGTPHYQAPEVLQGTGYSCAADYWSLGVLCYECICGSLPFAPNEDSYQKIKDSILKSKLKFPEDLPRSSPLRNFIEILLTRNPSSRRSEAAKFRTHPWFLGLEWVLSTQDLLFTRQLAAPLLPELSQVQSAPLSESLPGFIEVPLT